MISRQTKLFYEVAGNFYPSLAEAQKADLLALIPLQWPDGATIPAQKLAEWLLDHAEAVATILTTTPRSRNRKPRRDKGVPRKVKAEVVP